MAKTKRYKQNPLSIDISGAENFSEYNVDPDLVSQITDWNDFKAYARKQGYSGDQYEKELTAKGGKWNLAGAERTADFVQGYLNQYKSPAQIAQDKLDAENAELKGKLGEISNFESEYTKENPFNFNQDSVQMQAYRRMAENAKADTGRDISRSLAQRGVTDSGQSTRNIARMNQQFATGENQQRASDYLSQKQDYLGTKQNVFQQKTMGYQFQNQASQTAYDNAMTNYYQKLALEQQQAAMQWQQQQQQEQQGWDRFFNLAGTVAKFIPGL